MSLQALSTPRFVRKTQLAPNEYRKNFQQIDREVIETITSSEADLITPQMSKIYLKMFNAPDKFWEAAGVLRIEAEVRDGELIGAWKILCELVGAASATVNKAMRWMHNQGVIGYFSGKNGVGLRIFINRAVSSIGFRQAPAGKKILAFSPASTHAAPASTDEAAFNDSYAVLEKVDTDSNPGAPKSGAGHERLDKRSSQPAPHERNQRPDAPAVEKPPQTSTRSAAGILALEDVVTRLRAELEPAIHSAARQAAAREHERTREWLETRGLPKAARVAQHEAYNVLRKYGLVNETRRNLHAQAEVGRARVVESAPQPQPLGRDEVEELAGACLAMLETKGQSVERTLAGMSVAEGGFLLPDDVERVRESARRLIGGGHGGEGERREAVPRERPEPLGIKVSTIDGGCG